MPKLQEHKRIKHLMVKVTDKEYAAMIRKAKKYTGGNVSKWVRYSAIELEPKKEDLTNG